MRRLVFLLWLLPAGAAAGQDMPLSQVLIDGEDWKEVKLPLAEGAVLAGDAKGNLLVADSGKGDRSDHSRIRALTPDGKSRVFRRFEYDAVRGLCLLPNGDLCGSRARIGPLLFRGDQDFGFGSGGKVNARDVAAAPGHERRIYFIDPSEKAVFLYGRKEPVATDVGDPAGLAFWKDGGTLVVGDAAGKHLYAFRVADDGSLDAKEKYYTLRTRGKEPSGVRALVVDDARRLYAATNLGVQVFDPTGRLSGVINPPLRQPVTAVAFAGQKRDRLFIVCGGKLWQRKTRAKAAWPPDAKAK